jgi:predicted RNA binding protein YcfA (HicA-like mRNA interferase family)
VKRAEALLAAVRKNPGGLSFNQFEALLEACGWQFRRQKGSHRLWYSPAGHRLPIQKGGKHAKAYQVRQFISQYEKEHPHGKAVEPQTR